MTYILSLHIRMHLPSRLDRAVSRLAASPLRKTIPRLMVLKAIADAGHPVSADEIHKRVGASNCDLVTIYRCLEAFDGAGFVRRYFRANGASLFDVDLGEDNLHVIDKGTHKVSRIDGADVQALHGAVKAVQARLASEEGYGHVSVVLQFFASGRDGHSREPVSADDRKESQHDGSIARQLAIAVERMAKPLDARRKHSRRR
jgi:Fur family ferric uptake transcriptional regulator